MARIIIIPQESVVLDSVPGSAPIVLAEVRKVQIDGLPTLEMLQAIVGGYIEHVPDFERTPKGERADIWCNEDGIGEGLPVNALASRIWRDSYPKGTKFWTEPMLLGDVAIVVHESSDYERVASAEGWQVVKGEGVTAGRYMARHGSEDGTAWVATPEEAWRAACDEFGLI